MVRHTRTIFPSLCLSTEITKHYINIIFHYYTPISRAPLHSPATSLNKWICVCLLAAEEEISFPPTYRYERGSRDTYVWQKQKATGVCLLNSNNITDRLTPNRSWLIFTHFITSLLVVLIILLCLFLMFLSHPRWGLMFHPGVTGSCGNPTQKHTLSATPTVRWIIQHTFVSIRCNRGPLK